MEKILSSVSLLGLFLLGASANGHATEQTIRIPLYASSVHFNPSEMQDQSSLWVGRQINCQLVRQNGRSISNEAASKVQYLSSERIEFTLRNDVKFSDGSKVTARDVKASFEFLKNTKSIQKNVIDWVKEVIIISDEKLVYVLKKPVPQFLRFLGSPNYPIFSQEFLNNATKDPKKWSFPVSCGAYRVSAWNESDRKIQLVPNVSKSSHSLEFYFQNLNQIELKDVQKFDIISLPVVASKTPPAEYREERIFDPYQIFIGLNTSLPRWKRREDRCEFFSKLDRKKVLDAYGPLAEPATDLFPRGVLGFNSKSRNSDRPIVNQNGIKNTSAPLCLTFLSVSVPALYRDAYLSMVHDAGYTVKNKVIQNPVRYGPNFIKSKCDAIAVGFKSNYLDGYEYLVTFQKSGTNFTAFDNRDIAKRIEESQSIGENQSRAIEYQLISKDIEKECVAFPLITLPEKHVLIKRILATPGIGTVALNDYLLDQVK